MTRHPVLPYRRGSNLLWIITSASAVINSAQAQQPVSDTGGWPPRAFTLLCGLWLAGQGLINGNLDGNLAVCLAPIAHLFPWLRLLLWAQVPMGTGIRSLALSSRKVPKAPDFCMTPDRAGVWQWDILTVYNNASTSSGFFTKVKQVESSAEYEMTVKSPAFCNLDIKITFTANNDANIDEATAGLFRNLDEPSADEFLQYWRGLQAYQVTGNLAWLDKGQTISSSDISKAVEVYKGRDIASWGYANARLKVFVQDPTSISNESPLGAVAQKSSLTARHLVALLIYVKNFPDEYKVHPLIPLVVRWTHGRSLPTDNLYFTLPPVEAVRPGGVSTPISTIYPASPPLAPLTLRPQSISPISPPQNIDPTPAASYCKIDLSPATQVGTVQIDGTDFFGAARFPWIFGTLFGMVITFFTSLAGGANPSLAASIGLLLVRPYSSDYNYLDAGSPPSWNGRRRIRWDDGRNLFACGIFNGQTRVRKGNIGNSIARGCMFLMVGWLAWQWRAGLRAALSFGPINPVQHWVMLVAVILEFVVSILMFMCVYILRSWDHNCTAIVTLFCAIYTSSTAGLMVRFLVTGKGAAFLLFFSESYTLLACICTAQTFVGAGGNSGSVQMAFMTYWAHMIASSCFPYF